MLELDVNAPMRVHLPSHSELFAAFPFGVVQSCHKSTLDLPDLNAASFFHCLWLQHSAVLECQKSFREEAARLDESSGFANAAAVEQNVWQQCRDDDYHLAGQSRKGFSDDRRPIPYMFRVDCVQDIDQNMQVAPRLICRP